MNLFSFHLFLSCLTAVVKADLEQIVERNEALEIFNMKKRKTVSFITFKTRFEWNYFDRWIYINIMKKKQYEPLL